MTYSFNSTEARSVARNSLVIFREINAIMEQIITDAGNGLYETTVDDDTTMTDSTPTDADSLAYFSVWQGITTDRAKTDQMNQVISHFESLGYSIERRTNTSTETTFKWVINY